MTNGKSQRILEWQTDSRPSQWAAEHRTLTPSMSAEPGRWHNERTPYLVGIMDAMADPNIQQIVIVKSTQMGVSEACRNALGYWIDVDPGPCTWVMPDEKSLGEAIEERLQPMITSCARLKRHMTGRAWDLKQRLLRLDTMTVYGAWAGSPQALASRPCQRVVLDEVDKYPVWSGREADPIRLATERIQTFGKRKLAILISTPTLREGPIWQAWEQCGDKRVFECPCPQCGQYQELSYGQVRWDPLPKDTPNMADQIKQRQLAYYICIGCGEKIEEHERLPMIAAGRWRVGAPSSSVGFRISALYSPWRTWSDVAAEFMRCKDDPPLLQNFRNSWMAEPFEIQVAKPASEALRIKVLPENAAPARVAPEWGCVLLATADVQHDHFWYSIRAWGYGYRSQLVHTGMVFTFTELRRVCLESAFPIAGTQRLVAPVVLVIDSGARTDEVYEFAAQNLGRVYPIKGASHAMLRPWQSTLLTPRAAGQAVELRLVDTDYYKDMLARLMNDDDPKKWALNTETNEDYLRQLSSEHKVLNRRTGKPTWEKITSGAANHAWDLEVYQCAAAEWTNMGIVPLQPPAPPVTATAPAESRKPRDRISREFDEARRERERPYVNLADL